MNDDRTLNTAESRPVQAVFVSYATADRKQALSVCKAIERRGIRCWISCRDVAPGQNYQEQIVRAIHSARAMVLVFSKAANSSDEIKKELSLASRDRIPVIAVRMENVQPTDAFSYELSTRQWIDAFRGKNRAVDLLAEEIGRMGFGGDETDAVRAPISAVRSESVSRRKMLAAGSATAVALTGGAAWFWQSRTRLPVEAARLLEEGRDDLDEGTIDKISTAVARFRRATEIAPGSAEPWGALALAYERQALFAPNSLAEDLHSRAAEARRRALLIDYNDEDAIASEAMGFSIFEHWRRAELACRVALRRHPEHAALNVWMAMLLAQVGRFHDALPFIERAVATNPKFVIAQGFKVSILEDLGRMDEADTASENAFRTWPRQYGIWFTRLYHLADSGRGSQALAMIDDRNTRPLGIPDSNFDLVRVQIQAVASQKSADIEKAVAASLESARLGTGFAEVAMSIFGLLGRVDEAFEVINGYYFDRGFKLPEQRFSSEQGTFTGRGKRFTGILFRRIMKPIQSDVRFDPLVSTLRLKDYWASSGSRPDYLSWI